MAVDVASDLPWALDALRALGVAGGPVFAVLWWLERKERIESQKAHKELVVQVLTVTNQATASVLSVRDAVLAVREATKESATSLSALIRSIRKTG